MERFYPLPAKSRSRKNTAMTIKSEQPFSGRPLMESMVFYRKARNA
jgi:hypothetical protein